MKAAPLLRAWLHRLRAAGVRFHMRHRWLGWDDAGRLLFSTPAGPEKLGGSDTAVILALGGGSWARLGSDGAWVPWLRERGVAWHRSGRPTAASTWPGANSSATSSPASRSSRW